MARIMKQAEKYQHQSRQKFGDKELKSIIRSCIPEMNSFQVVEVKNNRFLHAAFLIKQAELLYTRGSHAVETEILIHATSRNNVDSILRDNLNWRCVRRAKYGFGVSFSHDAKYANKYCNNRNGTERVFIICEVLIGKMVKMGDNNDCCPRYGAHTYRTYNTLVAVKFDDFTFYPICVIFYSTKQCSLSSQLTPPILKQQFILSPPKVQQEVVNPISVTGIHKSSKVSIAGPSNASRPSIRTEFLIPQPRRTPSSSRQNLLELPATVTYSGESANSGFQVPQSQRTSPNPDDCCQCVIL